MGSPLVSREEREAALDAWLAPGATRPVGAGRRARPEEPDPYRLCFERDVDRVKHSRPFRRLAGKCQVFIAPEDDHLRTRMTHAIEVAQVAMSIARAARLCEPLAEAIALAHDVGHGPAGHTAEDAFSPYLEGGYDHALWGADVILAPANLCAETLDGVRNGPWRRPPPATPEAEVVSWADRIAYLCHDFDDACRAAIVRPDDLPAEIRDVVGVEQRTQVRRFIDAVLQAIDRTGRVGMVEPYASTLLAFREWNYQRIYLRPAARRQHDRAIALLRGLVEYYVDAPGRLPDVAIGRVERPDSGSKEAAELAVAYVGGMTDRFALSLGVELLGWRPEDLPRGA
ncbi:MAG: HD domain-containing protein [Acidimicrobiia bacterium]|nr:HD domain-containing protein [Acidimicrobiia bacterium]